LANEWRKAIPEKRDRLQSRVLVWVVGPLLAVPCLYLLIQLIVLTTGISAPRRYHSYPHETWLILMPWVVSLTFGVLVWALRAATPMAAFCGAMVCLILTAGAFDPFNRNSLHTGLAPLMALFVLTFVSTRLGRGRKLKAGLAESARGRNAAQVLANLGAAGLLVPMCWLEWFDWISRKGGFFGFSLGVLPVLLIAALCEATADTVSSEIGQAFGGKPFLLTTLRRVDPGTDGAVSLQGTAAGTLAAAIVAMVGMWAMHMGLEGTVIAFVGGIVGLFFDSLLGASVEREGWLGNDLVNFSSTIFAVVVALFLLAR
jgi:uncharacterized protein (TIGR00297 family)